MIRVRVRFRVKPHPNPDPNPNPSHLGNIGMTPAGMLDRLLW